MKMYPLLFLAFIFSLTTNAQATQIDESIPVTQMEFTETSFYFGKIKSGDIVQNVFELTNTGDEPLIITGAKGSCGCTVPDWPMEPIAPGENAYITVQFNSKGKKGQQQKRVTITANTDPQKSFLTFKGEVEKSEVAATADISTKITKRTPQKKVDLANIQVFPNPTSDFVNIDLSKYAPNKAVIEVYSMTGEFVERQQLNQLEVPFKLDISSYPKGNYSLSITMENYNRLSQVISKQ